MSSVTYKDYTCGICEVSLLLFLDKAKLVVKNEKFKKSDIDSLLQSGLTPIQAKCEHVFHANCIALLLQDHLTDIFHPKCPICKDFLTDAPFRQVTAIPPGESSFYWTPKGMVFQPNGKQHE